jgi:NAD-dependent deacetylase
MTNALPEITRPDLDPEDPIVILTGAGISKESGLDTFRDADGIWRKVRLEDVATPEGFARNPDGVHDFYNARRRTLLETTVVPNAAHEALVCLERSWPGGVLLVTQNIDDLHERAGSSPEGLIHMHGELFKVRCDPCGVVFDWRTDLSRQDPCPACGRPAGLRPHVVWFGEIPLEMERIHQALTTCGLFLSIGTSGTIYPAAGFVQVAKLEADAHTVELNLEAGEGSSLFDQHVHDLASRAVPTFVDMLLAGL